MQSISSRHMSWLRFILAVCAMPSTLPLNAAPVPASVEVKDEAGKPKIEVSFRLSSSHEVIKSASLWADNVETGAATYTPFAKLPDASIACAYVMDYKAELDFVTRDTKNFSRTTIGDLAKVSFADPNQKVSIYAFGQDLLEVAKSDATPDDALKQLGAFEMRRETAKNSAIVKSCIEVVAKLKTQPAQRRFVVLFTDGADDARQNPITWEPEFKKLMEAASTEPKVAIYSVAFEQKEDKKKKNYPWLKELCTKTGGEFAEVSVVRERLELGTLMQIVPSFSSGGKASFERSLLTGKKQWKLKLLADNSSSFFVPEPAVAVTAPVATPPPPVTTPGQGPGTTPATPTTSPDGKPIAQPSTPAVNPTPPVPPNQETAKKPDYMKWLIYAIPAGLLIILGFVFMGGKKSPEKADDTEWNPAEATALVAPQFHATAAPVATPLAFLDMMDASASREVITTTNVRIGRGKDNDLVLANKSVSNHHCVVQRSRDGTWSITDLDSGNHVFINDVKVERSALQDGDVIELGEVKMRFRTAA